MHLGFTVQAADISIHALREEGDSKMYGRTVNDNDFYPRPPRGGRHPGGVGLLRGQNFYPRPPRGGRPSSGALPGPALKISIHALREEGDGSAGVGRSIELISIHALREEGDG